MWLLRTSRAELKLFVSPEKAPRYAILSHVWDAREQSLQELQDIVKQCKTSGQVPRDSVCEKIYKCCKLAEADGYEWVWIDTCCIGKSSSAELSEAINSMFRYYSLSSVCYAYLSNVGFAGQSKEDCAVDFHHSRWHKRCWTLQELIAPTTVIFLSSSCTALGSKADRAEELETITLVPAALLRLEKGPP